jgi:cellulose synthase/poly-beta-1,6-N-acetylglucosamine synthase-like glycosyltransferase
MFLAFAVLAGWTLLQSLASLRNGWAWLRFVRSWRPEVDVTLPPVTLFLPVRGAEPEWRDNLRAYLEQDYPDYEVIVIADSPQNAGKAKVMVARPSIGEGDKVARLRQAIPAARAESTVFAFADSDGRPGRQWLRHLVAPLADPAVGAATGYRWYVAGGGAALVRSVWNSFILSLLGDHDQNFCWGGSVAVRRETFKRAGVEDYWKGSVSDDYQLTAAIRRAGLGIVFVPGCLVETHGECGWRELLAWTTRQIIITRVYAPRLWAIGLVSNGITAAAMVLGLLLASPLSLTMVGLAVLPGIVKGWLRAEGAAVMLPEHAAALRRRRWLYAALAAPMPLLNFANFVLAGFRRRIEWRGIRYQLRGPNDIRVLA